eukprot:scaffold2256_cov371-Prasinococcus_capsulatus_cf.AAC.11
MGKSGRVYASLTLYAIFSSLMLVVNKGAVMMIPEPIKLLLLQVRSIACFPNRLPSTEAPTGRGRPERANPREENRSRTESFAVAAAACRSRRRTLLAGHAHARALERRRRRLPGNHLLQPQGSAVLGCAPGGGGLTPHSCMTCYKLQRARPACERPCCRRSSVAAFVAVGAVVKELDLRVRLAQASMPSL